MEDCFTKRKNIGTYLCSRLPQLMKRAIWSPEDFRVPVASRELKTFWQDAIYAVQDRLYLWPPFVKMEMISTEAAYEITPLAQMHLHDGQYVFRAHYRQNLCTHKNMYTHKGSGGRLFPFDIANQLAASIDDDGSLMGLKVALVNPEKLAWGTGESATTSPIYVVLEDPSEMDKSGDVFPAKFVNSLTGIVDVVFTKVAGLSAAGSVVYDIEIACDSLPVVGLIAADFLLYEANGVTPHAISGVVESLVIPGRYTISGAGFASGMLLTLKDAFQLSLNGYEHETPTALIIP